MISLPATPQLLQYDTIGQKERLNSKIFLISKISMLKYYYEYKIIFFNFQPEKSASLRQIHLDDLEIYAPNIYAKSRSQTALTRYLNFFLVYIYVIRVNNLCISEI